MLRFSEILGHETVKENLQNAVRIKKVSHAYIITGEAGMGRKSLANAFILSLFCESGEEDACMHCHSCRQIISRNHPDCIYVTHEKPGSIGVEDIRRQVNDTIFIRPYSAGYKVYVIDEAEKMTVQAQNALLKTIEEPPSYAVILLLTVNQEVFLPTILSRCIQLTLKPLKDSVIKDYLMETMKIKEADADIYSAFARGNLGKAINLASSEDFQLLHSELLYLLKNLKQMNIAELLDFIKKLKEEDIDLLECLDFMQFWYRDVLMFKVTKDVNLLIFKDEYASINELSQKSGYEGLENILAAIDKARIRLAANVNTELVLELMLLVMKEN